MNERTKQQTAERTN